MSGKRPSARTDCKTLEPCRLWLFDWAMIILLRSSQSTAKAACCMLSHLILLTSTASTLRTIASCAVSPHRPWLRATVGIRDPAGFPSAYLNLASTVASLQTAPGASQDFDDWIHIPPPGQAFSLALHDTYLLFIFLGGRLLQDSGPRIEVPHVYHLDT